MDASSIIQLAQSPREHHTISFAIILYIIGYIYIFLERNQPIAYMSNIISVVAVHIYIIAENLDIIGL